MLRRFFVPLHPDGLRFVLAAAPTTVILFLLWAPAGWLGVILTLWIAYFFRDPWRVTPERSGLLVSPADGIVVSIAAAALPSEIASGDATPARIGIFLNIFDVHVTRCPVGGRVTRLRYRKGRFVNASFDKASEDNERMAIRIAPTEGPEVVFVQVAGLVARRIVCDLREGQQVAAGQRIGIIRFGSRVDVYCPPPYVPMVIAGQRVVGGETVLADLYADEPPRQGIAQ
ncbi:MAG: phosphatidylserine decarboxylase [Alphaproteobacteria bacterium]|nr:phosphatidylserine decarboxylase [Alphaproteobacteria bacterium]